MEFCSIAPEVNTIYYKSARGTLEFGPPLFTYLCAMTEIY